jgi:hypothetical protein
MLSQSRSDDHGRRRWWFRGFSLLILGILATGVQGAELNLMLNHGTYTAGDTLTLTASADPQGDLVDVYIALFLPSAEFFFLTPTGGLTTTPQTLTPDGLAEVASAEIFHVTLTGDEPLGPYVWLGVLTAHGTTEFVSEIVEAPFIVAPVLTGEPLTGRSPRADSGPTLR